MGTMEKSSGDCSLTESSDVSGTSVNYGIKTQCNDDRTLQSGFLDSPRLIRRNCRMTKATIKITTSDRRHIELLRRDKTPELGRAIGIRRPKQ